MLLHVIHWWRKNMQPLIDRVDASFSRWKEIDHEVENWKLFVSANLLYYQCSKITLYSCLYDHISECEVKPHRKPKYRHYYADNLVNGWVCELCTCITRIICLICCWIFIFQNIKTVIPILITLLELLGDVVFFNSLYHTRVLNSSPISLFFSPRFVDQTLLLRLLMHFSLSLRLALAITKIFLTSHLSWSLLFSVSPLTDSLFSASHSRRNAEPLSLVSPSRRLSP